MGLSSQLDGLGSSEMALRYAVRNLKRPGLTSPIHSGARLEECAQAVLDVPGKSALEILGA